MTGFLLDTCVISEFRKAAPDAGVQLWLSRVDPSRVYLSSITIGELRYGIEALPDGGKRADLERWFVEMLDTVADRIVSLDGDSAQEWGRLRATAQRSGRTTPSIDALIAATARAHGLSLVTRNERDFDLMRVSVVNPWSTS